MKALYLGIFFFSNQKLDLSTNVNKHIYTSCAYVILISRSATAGKSPKDWDLPRFWVSIRSYKKQPVKKNWDRILGLAWFKFAVAPLTSGWSLWKDELYLDI